MSNFSIPITFNIFQCNLTTFGHGEFDTIFITHCSILNLNYVSSPPPRKNTNWGRTFVRNGTMYRSGASCCCQLLFSNRMATQSARLAHPVKHTVRMMTDQIPNRQVSSRGSNTIRWYNPLSKAAH